jgi:hypothetical protein
VASHASPFSPVPHSFAVHRGPWLFWLTVRLNARALGPGQLGLAQADVWVDLALALTLLVAFLLPLAASWAMEPPGAETNPWPANSVSSALAAPQSALAAASRATRNQEGALRAGDVAAAAAKQTRARRRHFLALGCDAAVLLAWASFSRCAEEAQLLLEGRASAATRPHVRWA